jgi:hypothetical protein
MRRTLVLAAAVLGSGFLGGVSLGLASVADAADWRTDQDNYEAGLFLDVSSYKLLPNGDRQVWILQAFPTPLESRGGPLDFRISLYEFDCSARTQAVKDAVVFFMDGKSDSDAKTWAASLAPADPGAERMSEVVCGDMSRLTSVPGEAAVIAHRYRALAKMLLH